LATLKDIYDEAKCDVQVQEVSESVEGCTTSSSEIEPQMTTRKKAKILQTETSPLLLLHI
jgi:hypothetical protein